MKGQLSVRLVNSLCRWIQHCHPFSLNFKHSGRAVGTMMTVQHHHLNNAGCPYGSQHLQVKNLLLVFTQTLPKCHVRRIWVGAQPSGIIWTSLFVLVEILVKDFGNSVYIYIYTKEGLKMQKNNKVEVPDLFIGYVNLLKTVLLAFLDEHSSVIQMEFQW